MVTVVQEEENEENEEWGVIRRNTSSLISFGSYMYSWARSLPPKPLPCLGCMLLLKPLLCSQGIQTWSLRIVWSSPFKVCRVTGQETLSSSLHLTPCSQPVSPFSLLTHNRASWKPPASSSSCQSPIHIVNCSHVHLLKVELHSSVYTCSRISNSSSLHTRESARLPWQLELFLMQHYLSLTISQGTLQSSWRSHAFLTICFFFLCP